MRQHSTTGQMQIGEMVMVLVVVIIIAISGLVWYTKSSAQKTTTTIDKDTEVDLATTAHFVADMPELHGSLKGSEDATVIDWERAKAFANTIDGATGKNVYTERLHGFKAELDCIAPCSDGSLGQNHVFTSLTLFDYTDHDAARRNTIPFVIPVVLRDPVTDDSSFGTLTLTQVLP